MPRNGDYIPRKDNTFRDWLGYLVSKLEQNLDELGLVEADIAGIKTAYAEFDSAFEYHLDMHAKASAATVEKNFRRGNAESEVRNIFRRVMGNTALPESMRVELGLKAFDSRRSDNETRGKEVPILSVKTALGMIYLNFYRPGHTKRLCALPSWAIGCKIYRRKNDEKEFKLIGIAVKSPFIDKINGPAAQYTYYAQYQGKDNNIVGGESNPVTVAASGAKAA